jgi:hypothetical protein
LLHVNGDRLPCEQNSGGNPRHESHLGDALQGGIPTRKCALNAEFDADSGFAGGRVKTARIGARASKARVNVLQVHAPTFRVMGPPENSVSSGRNDRQARLSLLLAEPAHIGAGKRGDSDSVPDLQVLFSTLPILH